ncbi:hypothetical protein [Jannaschia sp. 2305UL9-9]|uniref:hypothetical protein n=1 Tax=Jannaschia sp. 2305UL9-9 TaxID=3121638 RepID=UPI003527B13B
MSTAAPVEVTPSDRGDFDTLLRDLDLGTLAQPFGDAVPEMRGFFVDPAGRVRDARMGAAHASNEAGLIVGEGPAEGGVHAMLWSADQEPRDLGDLPGGPVAGVARAVNAAGVIVGRGRTADGDRAFVWDEINGMRDLTVVTDVGPDVILLDATGIDDDGRIVGRAVSNGIEQAFLWTPQTAVLDLAGPSDDARGHVADLTGIGGQVAAAGMALSDDGRPRPVVWRPGAAAIDLGDLPGGPQTGSARDIDVNGRVVGYSATEDGDRAFLWTPDGAMRDLNDLIDAPDGIVLTAAVSIISDGRILAYGPQGSHVHFYRLTPVQAPTVLAQMGAPDSAILTGSQTYDITDLGAFVGTSTASPILSMDETGRVVGACDVLMPACPYLSELEGITNFFADEDGLSDPGSAGDAGFGEGTGGVSSPTPGLLTELGPTVVSASSGGPGGTRLVSTGGGTFSSFGDGGLPIFGTSTSSGGTTGTTLDPSEVDLGTIAAVPLPPAWLALLGAFGFLSLLRRRTSVS